MGLTLFFTLRGIDVNIVSSNVYIIRHQLYTFKVIKHFDFNVVVPRMQGTLDDFAVYLPRSKRAVLMATECLNCIIAAVCIKKRNSCAIDVTLLSAVLFNFTLLGDLDKCQLPSGCNQSGYKLVIRQPPTDLRHI